MQSRIRFLIYSEAYGGYLNRMADGIIQNMFKAISFESQEEADQWMLGIYAPKDSENYEVQRTKTVIGVENDE